MAVELHFAQLLIGTTLDAKFQAISVTEEIVLADLVKQRP
jgi:hypothetical protein